MSSGKLKYPRNKRGLFDCPETDCDCKGSKGFDSPQEVGVHRRLYHKPAAATIGRIAHSALPRLAVAMPDVDSIGAASFNANRVTIIAMATVAAAESLRELNRAEAELVLSAILASK